MKCHYRDKLGGTQRLFISLMGIISVGLMRDAGLKGPLDAQYFRVLKFSSASRGNIKSFCSRNILLAGNKESCGAKPHSKVGRGQGHQNLKALR